jgi:hypothetical protein
MLYILQLSNKLTWPFKSRCIYLLNQNLKMIFCALSQIIIFFIAAEYGMNCTPEEAHLKHAIQIFIDYLYQMVNVFLKCRCSEMPESLCMPITTRASLRQGNIQNTGIKCRLRSAKVYRDLNGTKSCPWKVTRVREGKLYIKCFIASCKKCRDKIILWCGY